MSERPWTLWSRAEDSEFQYDQWFLGTIEALLYVPWVGAKSKVSGNLNVALYSRIDIFQSVIDGFLQVMVCAMF